MGLFQDNWESVEPYFGQDYRILKKSNGKIVEQEPIIIKSEFSDRVECYRIKYLSDGLKVVGFVIKPKGEGNRYPCIIFNRGGGGEISKLNNTSLKKLIYLSSNNYVVLASQYRGIDGGQGRAEFGGKDVNDVLNLIETVKSLPFIAPNKIVMFGASRGGMMTYLAIKHGAEITAAVVLGGITDLEQFYYETNPEIQEEIRELVGMDKREWEIRSAYYWPHEIDVPILILHGERDKSINVSQSKKLAKRLDREGKTHELVVFPEGDHSLSEHRAEVHKRIFEWFEKYLYQ